MGDEQGDKYLTDVNGDGLADYIKHDLHGNYHVQLSNGDGTFSVAIPSDLDMATSDWPEVYPVDVNGDGLSDLVRWDIYRNVKVHLSYGDGRFGPELISNTSTLGSESRYIHFVDMNGDGLADFVKRNLATGTIGIHYSKGDGYFEEDGTNIVTQEMSSEEGLGHLLDVTGDGVADIIRHDAYGNYDVYALENLDADLMRAVGVNIDHSGESGYVNLTEIEYRPSSEYPNLVLPFVTPTVASIKKQVLTLTETPSGYVESLNQYDYSGGYYDAEMREFRGFETVVNTRPDNAKVTTHYLQGLYFKNKSDHVTMAKPDGTVLQETASTWAKDPADDDWAFVYLDSAHTDYYFNPTVSSQTDYTYSTIHGGVLTQITSGTGAESVTTSYVHVNKGAWVWRTASESVAGSASGKLRETAYEYETNTGNLLAQEMWLSDGTDPRVTMTYDAYGNLHTRTNARGFTTTTDYDTVMHAFPVRITFPETSGVAHVVEYRNYDYRWGKPSQSIDENGNIIDYSFDNLGRLIQADLPDGGQFRRVFVDDQFPRMVSTFIREKAEDGSDLESTVDVFTWLDGYGRKITSFTYGDPDQNNDYTLQLVRKDSYFDEMGRNYYNVGPYFDGSSEDKPSTRTFFDYLNRPTLIEKPDAEHGTIGTTLAYSGFNITVTDPDGAKKTKVKDYRGRITQVIEHADAGDQYTDYEYNAVGELEKVTDHLYHETTIAYDTLGRKTAMDDPDMGIWSYTYDANGNLEAQTDNKSQTVTFDYDALDRMVGKTYDTGDEPVSYTYDQGAITNGIGRLYEIAKGDVRTVMTGYDAMGRSLGETQYIPGMTSTTEFAYDLSGKLTKVTYPNGLWVNTAHIPKTGLIGTISVPFTTPYIVASFYDYRPSGKIGTIKRGQADGGGYLLTDTYTYAPISDRLEKITTQAAGVSEWLQYREYDYTPAGDIEQIKDCANNRTYTYTYDKLHRLTSETAVGMFSYRPDSELVYDYDEAHQPHAVQSIEVNGIPAAGFYYDDNGNMTNGPDLTDPDANMVRNLVWDADNMPTSVAHSQHGTTTFLYDGNGRRVKKTSPAGTTYYINKYYEVINGSGVMYFWAGNQRIAQWKDGENPQFFHKDHLGSSSFMTNDEGVKIEETEYFPFGSEREHTGLVVSNYKFTDQEHDQETALYNYDARLYDPIIGRFINSDSINHNVFNPQLLDKYSYVKNNPLSNIDPTGNIPIPTYRENGASKGFVIDNQKPNNHNDYSNYRADLYGTVKEGKKMQRGAERAGQGSTDFLETANDMLDTSKKVSEKEANERLQDARKDCREGMNEVQEGFAGAVHEGADTVIDATGGFVTGGPRGAAESIVEGILEQLIEDKFNENSDAGRPDGVSQEQTNENSEEQTTGNTTENTTNNTEEQTTDDKKHD